MRTYHNEKAPLAATDQKVLLTLTVPSSIEGGKMAALDLVVVVDISGSMRGHKLHNLKTAMNFVITKLGEADRLSIIPFSTTVEKKQHKLVNMNGEGKEKAMTLVHKLEAHGTTDISAGLKAGLKVLQEREHKDGRAAGILLMSDGLQNEGGDARKVAGIGNATVDTFGFGADHDPVVLEGIATKSHGGTFNYVRDDTTDTLTTCFSQPLAGLHSVVLLGLKLILKNGGGTIKKVDPGTYPQKTNTDGSVTVDFGHLYSHESRLVLVFLHLPATHYEHTATVMIAEYEYSVPGDPKKKFDGEEIQMNRIETADPHAIKLQVKMEQVRRDHASSIRNVKTTADNKKLHDAREKLEDALKALEEILEDQDEGEGAMSTAMVESLFRELNQLRDLIESPELYKKQGRAYALASISSHERQRFTARGGAHHVRLFATPRMDEDLDHATMFHDNPDVNI